MAELDRVVTDPTMLADPTVQTDPTVLAELVGVGEPGLPALQRLIQAAQDVLAGTGAVFLEFSATGGRVIAASGVSLRSVGRRIDVGGPLADRFFLTDGPIQARTADQPAAFASQLVSHGIGRLLGIRVDAGPEVVGGLFVCFADGDGVAGPAQQAAIEVFAQTASQIYHTGRGLPVHAAAPPVAAIADAIAVVGPDGVVCSWNPAAAAATGWPAGAVLGRQLPVPLPAAGQIVEHRLPDGRWLQILATELPSADGRVVTLRDISEAHRREQARELFVALTSHELRTPVTVIKGYADTLVEHWDELDESSRRDAAQRLGQRAGELARLVERLLSAVGDGSGLSAPMPLPFDLVDALRAAVAELPSDTRRLVQVELPAMLPKALGERASLATVLAELINNAVKYSSPESPVSLYGLADADTVGFRVADRGVGVRPEHVERAFERFWQAESGKERKYGGVGLGLYLVRRIIERQNGWVSLRPREWGGTVAEVRLPRADLGPGEA